MHVFWQGGHPLHCHCLVISQLAWKTNGAGHSRLSYGDRGLKICCGWGKMSQSSRPLCTYMVLCKLGVSAERSCHVLLSWTSTPALYWKLEVFSLRGWVYSQWEQWMKYWGKMASGRTHSPEGLLKHCKVCLSKLIDGCMDRFIEWWVYSTV